MRLKHVGANSFTSVTAYVILYSYIQVHKLVQIESLCKQLINKLIRNVTEGNNYQYVVIYH